MGFIENEKRIEEVLIKEYCRYVEYSMTGILKLELTFFKGKLMSVLKSDKQTIDIAEVDTNPLNRMRSYSQEEKENGK